MFFFAEWDSVGSLIAEFMLSAVVVIAIVMIVNRVNRKQAPPASAQKQPSGDAGLRTESSSSQMTAKAESEQYVEPTAPGPRPGPGS